MGQKIVQDFSVAGVQVVFAAMTSKYVSVCIHILWRQVVVNSVFVISFASIVLSYHGMLCIAQIIQKGTGTCLKGQGFTRSLEKNGCSQQYKMLLHLQKVELTYCRWVVDSSYISVTNPFIGKDWSYWRQTRWTWQG